MRWVLMLFVILASVMGGEARAVVVTGRSVVSERVGKAEETAAKRVEALRVESERAFLGAALEARKAAGFVDAGPLGLWFPGGVAVARSDCGDRSAKYTVTAAAGSAWTVPSAPTVQHVRGPDLGGGTKGLLYSLRNGLPTFNRYNGRGDVVAQSDIDGTTTWAASYQADGRRTAEAGTNIERHRACTKEEDPTGLLNEGFRYRDMETGTFISRDPLGHVDGPNVYCYVGQNPWTHWDPEGLFVGALVKRINEHVIRPAAESLVGAVIDALPQSAVEQLSNSRGFESAMEAGRTVSRGIMHGSQEALGMLSPMDGAADKLLKGDLGGAGNEAMLEAFGGRVFKAAGKGMAAVKRHAGKLDEAVGVLSHADDAATATATGVRESIEEASSVLAKEGGGVAKSAPWTQVSSDARAILRDVEGRTGMTIPSKQRSLLADQVRTVDHQIPVSDAQYKALQAQYRSSRPSMIADWEANTGQVWPSGEQAHHIIPTRYGGPNQWWNIHPAQGSVHQGGIHGVGSPTQSVFPTPVPR